MADTERVSIPQQATFNYPLKVKHIFLTFMQEFCALQNPSALMHFNPTDPSSSNIWIMDSYAHDIEDKVGVKPALVFKRGPMYVAQGFLSDNLLREESYVDHKYSTPDKPVYGKLDYKSFMFSGQADWMCISRQGMEAEAIAAVVAMVHRAHIQVLKQKGLHEIKSIQIGEEMMIEGDVETEMISVPVTISYDLQAHYEMWDDGVPFNRAWLKGTVESEGLPDGDMLLNTDP
jgi:hypothetical protein